ncbi:MAG: type II toxin-antitoxin system HicA family toxin [bacterium]
MLKNISGDECVKVLCKHFGFKMVRQKGSHIILRKELDTGAIGTVVPAHREIKTGTLKGILELAKVDENEFEKFL